MAPALAVAGRYPGVAVTKKRSFRQLKTLEENKLYKQETRGCQVKRSRLDHDIQELVSLTHIVGLDYILGLWSGVLSSRRSPTPSQMPMKPPRLLLGRCHGRDKKDRGCEEPVWHSKVSSIQLFIVECMCKQQWLYWLLSSCEFS